MWCPHRGGLPGWLVKGTWKGGQADALNLALSDLAFFWGGGQQAAAPSQEARTKNETHTVMNHWWWLNTHELRETIIQKKSTLRKGFIKKRGGGHLDFILLFFIVNAPKYSPKTKINFHKTPTGGRGHRFMKLFRKIDFFLIDGLPKFWH